MISRYFNMGKIFFRQRLVIGSKKAHKREKIKRQLNKLQREDFILDLLYFLSTHPLESP